MNKWSYRKLCERVEELNDDLRYSGNNEERYVIIKGKIYKFVRVSKNEKDTCKN